MKKKCPCKDCEKRLIGCHTFCPDYKDWRKAYERQLKENHVESAPLSRQMLKYVWRNMLGR